MTRARGPIADREQRLWQSTNMRLTLARKRALAGMADSAAAAETISRICDFLIDGGVTAAYWYGEFAPR